MCAGCELVAAAQGANQLARTALFSGRRLDGGSRGWRYFAGADLVSAVEPDFVSPEEPESVAGEVALSVLLLAPVPEPEVLLVPALSVL